MSPARRRGWGILGRETAREPLAKGEEKDNMGMCGRRKREGRGRRGVEAEVDIDESKLPRGDMATPGPHARRSLRCLLRGRQKMRVSHSRGRGLSQYWVKVESWTGVRSFAISHTYADIRMSEACVP